MRTISATFAAILFVSAILCSTSLTSHAQESPAAKTARLLNESKVKFTKVDDGIWTIPYEGKQLKSFDVIVTSAKDVLVMFAIVSNQKDYRATPELMRKLLGHNDQFDRVKIGIDKDGSVIVRIDLSMRLVDRKELIDSLDQTAAASDEVYRSIVPFLNAAK